MPSSQPVLSKYNTWGWKTHGEEASISSFPPWEGCLCLPRAG